MLLDGRTRLLHCAACGVGRARGRGERLQCKASGTSTAGSNSGSGHNQPTSQPKGQHKQHNSNDVSQPTIDPSPRTERMEGRQWEEVQAGRRGPESVSVPSCLEELQPMLDGWVNGSRGGWDGRGRPLTA